MSALAVIEVNAEAFLCVYLITIPLNRGLFGCNDLILQVLFRSLPLPAFP